jgi:hypothetical protein
MQSFGSMSRQDSLINFKDSITSSSTKKLAFYHNSNINEIGAVQGGEEYFSSMIIANNDGHLPHRESDIDQHNEMPYPFKRNGRTIVESPN